MVDIFNSSDLTLDDVLNRVSDTIIDEGLVSPSHKKMINSALTTEAKKGLIKENTLQKTLNLDGFKEAEVQLVDGDSAYLIGRDETGNIVSRTPIRFNAYANYDSADQYKDVIKSAYKQATQPQLVSQLTGKPEHLLMPEDYANVDAYHALEMYRSMTSDKDTPFVSSIYDPTHNYTLDDIKPVKMMVRLSDKDKYGRYLAEVVNPKTGKDVGFEASNNPELNASFDLYKSINTTANRRNIERKFEHKDVDSIVKAVSDKYDTDKRLSEDLDLIQSTAYQSAARVLQYGPDWLVDKEKWESIANAETGQALADAWAGVKTSTRKEYATTMAKAIDDWDKGNYTDSIVNIATQFDRMLAESATQMGLRAGGTIVAGATGIGGIAAVLSGAMLAAVDSTLAANEDYKINNNGKDMSADNIATTFAGNVALLIPETLFMGFSISKFIPKTLANKIGLAYKSTSPIEAAKIIGGSAIGEGLQEISQDTFNEYMSQDQSKPKSLLDIATSPEMAVSGIAGGIMGAGLSSVPASVGAIRTSYIDNKNSKIREEVTTNNQNMTITGDKANTDLSNQVNSEISNTTIDYTNRDAVKEAYTKLNEQANNSDISVEALENIKRKQAELLLNHIKATDDKANRDAFLKATGKSKEEAFDEIVYFSDLNAQRLYEETGKRATEVRKEEVTKELLEVAKSLDISEEYARKSFKEVQSDIRFGAKGYYTYRDKIIDIDNKLQDTSLSQEDIDKLNNSKNNLLGRLHYLYNNQVNKLERFAEAVEKISEGNTNSVTFEYPSTEGSFTVRSTDLATNLRGATKGAFSVIEGIEREIKNINDIISNHTSEEQYSSLGIDTGIAESISNRITNAATNIRNRSKSAAATTITGKPKDMSKVSNRDLMGKLRNVGSGKIEGKSLANLVGYLRNVPTERLEEVRQETLNSKLSKEQKDAITKGIDTVINIESTTIAETNAIEDSNSKLTKQAKDILNSLTDEVINTSDVNTLVSTVNNLRKLFRDIQALGKESNSELLKSIADKGKQLNERHKKLTEKEFNKVEQDSTFTNHSGGAIGSDTYWGEIGNKYNIPTKHYYLGKKTPNGNIEISKEDTAEGKVKVTKAAIQMGRINPNHTVKNELLIRDWAQVKYADAVFAVTTLLRVGDKIDSTRIAKIPQGKGGTGYAIQMAINEDKPVYVYDQVRNQWFTYKNNTWVKTDTPVLTKNFAGIGTRNLNENGKKAIENVFNKTFNTLKQDSTKELTTSTSNDTKEVNTSSETSVKTESLLHYKSNHSVILGNRLPVYRVDETEDGKTTKTKIDTVYFNLNNELEVDKNSTSVLAKEGISSILLSKVLDIADKIKFNPYEISGIRDYFSYLIFKFDKNKNIVAPNGILHSSPHLRLLYNITPEEKIINGKKVQGLNFEYNPITVFAVDLGVKELLTNTDLKSVLNPIIKRDLASMFGLKVEEMTDEQVSELKNHINKYGVPKSVLADRLGKLIIHNLGLKANLEKGTVGFYERVCSGLGMYAISYAAKMGYLTETRYEADNNSLIKKNMTCIKKTTKSIGPLLDTYLGPKDKDGKRKGGLRDKFKVTNNIVKTPRTTVGKLPRNMTLRHTNGLVKVPSFTKSVLEKLWNTSYEMDLELVDFIKDNLDELKKRLKYLDEKDIDLLTLDSQHSAEGVNLSIDDQFKYLFDYAKVQKEGNKFYFDWFISSNGRVFMDSNTLNPQTSKSVQRFVCLPSNIYRDFDPTNQSDINNEYFAIAQAFDSLGAKEDIKKLGDTINSLSLDELLQLRKDLINMDENAFKNKYASKGIEGVENYGQCLNVLQHLIRKKQANGKTFKTWLAIENDSTTSGYFIRLLQFCNPEILKKFGEKVGIILANSKLPHEAIHELKKLPGFLDIYKTMALDTSKKLPVVSNEEEKNKRIKELEGKIKELQEQRKNTIVQYPVWSRVGKRSKRSDTVEGMSNDMVENFVTYLSDIFVKTKGKSNELLIDRKIPKRRKIVTLTYKSKLEPNIINVKFTIGTNKTNIDISVIDTNTNEDITTQKSTPNYLEVIHDAYKDWMKADDPMYKSYLQQKAYENELRDLRKGSTNNQLALAYAEEVDKRGFSLDVLSNTFIKMYDALPKPTQEGTVDSALRTLLKSPSMIFGYTAGENSIRSKVSLEIMKEFISTYNKIDLAGGLKNYLKENKIEEDSDTAKKLTAINNTMKYLDKFSTIKGKSIIQQLKTKSSSEVFLNINGKKTTLSRYFVTVLGPTYGKAIWDSLSESFREFIQYNDSMNHMMVNMFVMFKTVLDSRLKSIKDDPRYISGVPISKRNKVIESLSELFPTLPLFYSNNREEGMLLMKTEKIRTFDAQVQNPRVIDGKLVQESTNANIYDFANPGKRGAVLPIHFTDGMMAMMTLNNFNDVIPVHDAFVMSALDNKSLTQSYNHFGYALNKDFNIYEVMTNRFIEVVKEYNKIAEKEGLPLSKALNVINGLNKEILRDGKPASIDTFIKEVTELSIQNNKNREAFYNVDNPVYITNMDGIDGSGVEANVNMSTLPEIVFKNALEKWKDYSGPKGYVTEGEIKETLQEATDNVEARVKLFDKLQELSVSLGNKVENESHLNHLKDLIRRIDIKKIQDVIIEVSKNRPFSSGMLDGNTVTIGFDDKVGELDSITRLSPFSDKSAAEIYAHELTHAAMRFALANGNTLKIKPLIDQILKLQLVAKKVVTWEDFMPTIYDANLKEVYEENAKRIYDYIFNNSDIKNFKGVNEFIAYGLTNENLMNKLKQHYVPSDVNSEKMSVLDKLIKIGHTIFNIVFGNKRVSDLVSVLADITDNTLLNSKRNTLYKELDILTNKIIGANNKATSSLREQINKPIEHLFKLFVDLRIKGNKIVSPKLHALFNLADIKGKTFDWLMNPNGNMFNNTLRFLNMLSLLLVSKSRRRALKESIIAVTGISQQNAIMSLLRDLEEPDLQSARLELITMLTRTVEQSSKSLESITTKELLDAFSKPLKEEEKIALTQSALFTDISSLLDDHDIKYVKNVLSDNNFRITEINKILHKLQDEEHYLYYKNQAYGLARFMVYGLGNSMQNLNAENIARGLLTNHFTTNVSDELIKNIDKLATLYAIEFTTDNSNKILANLDDKGLKNFLITHRNFVKESKEGIRTTDENGNIITTKTITDIHTIKGYTKQLFDSTYDVKVDFIHKKKDLAKEGYSLVHKLKSNDITQTNDLAIYRRTFSNPNRRNGAGFILSGTNAIGSTLKDTAFKMKAEINVKDELTQKDIWKLFISNINGEAKKFSKLMHTKDMTFEDFEKLSSNYTPIVSPVTNRAVDYRITMSTKNKQELLNMDMNGISILSKMYASQNTKLNASIRNKALIEFIKDDTKNNMVESTKRGRDTGIKYILLDKNTDNKYLKESWAVIPNELKEEIEKGNFYIREDWLQSLFGIRDISFSDWSVLKRDKAVLIRRGIAIAEYILKTLSYIAKRNIVLLVPGVLVNNVISNLNYSIMNGANPIKVAKMQLANAKAIRTYLEDKKVLNRIEFRERIGTATKEEIDMKNIYKSKLQNNIVHPLMEKGMYQSIVEDINIDDLESIGKISKFLKNSKVLNKIPNAMKWMSRQLYMTEGTPIYDFMFQATQYSDFIARATEYQLQMEKAPKKYEIVERDGKRYKELTDKYVEYEERVTIGILNAFINYDKPQSSIEQYLNDIGLFMFTKFAKRIQHVILKSSMDNPIGVLMFLLGQHYILDTEDIMEQNIINKHWTALIHNPVDNFINAVTPMPLQYYFGMRNTGL